MLYHINGLTSDRINTMNPKEREWWLDRLSDQLEKETNAIKKGST